MSSFDEYVVLGRRALVGSREPEARHAIRQLLHGFGPVPAGPSSAPDLPRYELSRAGDVWYAYGESLPLHADRDFVVALRMLEWHVLTAALDRHHELFHLHGGVLAAPREKGAVVLVGRSGSGKSTLTLALTQRGFLPFADDIALIEPATLDVRPFHRAFHVSTESLQLVERALGGPVPSGGDVADGFFRPPAWAAAPVPVRWLLLLELAPDEEPQLLRLGPAEAAPAVLEHSLNLQKASRTGLVATARLTREAACYRFRHGNLPASVSIVEGLVSGN